MDDIYPSSPSADVKFAYVMLACILLLLADMARLRYSKDKPLIPNPKQWFKNKYTMHISPQILPTHNIKAKESPMVGPDPVSPALPTCPKLDGAEKGKNIMFRVRAPTAWFHDDTVSNEIKVSISV